MKFLFSMALLAIGVNSDVVSLENLIQLSKQCKQNQIWTKAKGCIRSCNDPIFSSCADAFIDIWDPKFCALGTNGKWNSFTFDCQACGKGQGGYLGVANGKCSGNEVQQKDSLIKAPVQLDRCSVVRCMSGTTCYLGTCYPTGTCSTSKQCKVTETCINGKCVGPVTIDKCALIKCSSGFVCKNGVCIKNTPPVDPCSKCLSTQTCSEGKCINKCELIDCMYGFQCKNGNCIKLSQSCKQDTDCPITDVCQDGKCFNLCVTSKCSLGYTCKHGSCAPQIPDVQFCPSNQKVNTKVCSLPRPTQKTCETVYYKRAPDPLFCGVQSNGSRINFARECEACKETSILYYFDQPCHKVPFICSGNEKCNGDFCESECKTREDCPYDWQDCSSSKCVDPCIYMRCAGCKYGKCGFQEPGGKCPLGDTSGCANKDWTCVGFECADLCLRTPCPPNHSCSNGVCSPNKK